MDWISAKGRLWLAMALWAVGLLLMAALSWWQLNALAKDAENRLIGDAGRTASQLAALLSLPGVRLDMASVRALAEAAMEDEGIYAIHIKTRRGISEGQRRNYLWEPVPWDDEIAENCVQGMSPIRVAGNIEGKVEVWLSPRMEAEEEGLAAQRENLRLGALATLWTFAFLLLLWQWGEFKNFSRWLARDSQTLEGGRQQGGEIVLGLAREGDPAGGENHESGSGGQAAQPLVSARLGQQFQSGNAAAFLVTAGMFRQTFGRAPALISRLYAEGESAGLCHLGRMLEQAAPCVGARQLEDAARAMQAALNDPHSRAKALAVENCARVLENTLEALGEKRQAASTPPETEEIS